MEKFGDEAFIYLLREGQRAGREEDVQRNGMEDTDPFPWDLGEEDLLAELRVVLDVGCPACGKRREEEG